MKLNEKRIIYRFRGIRSLRKINLSHEIKIISEIIQPQGARVKPQDQLLISFGKACEVLQTEIIGSILISNLTTEVSWFILIIFIKLKI